MKTKNTKTRPQLTKDLKSEDFMEYYFLKEELKEFCRREGLKIGGSKNQLEERIIYYLDTGKSLDESVKDGNKTKNHKSVKDGNKTKNHKSVKDDNKTKNCNHKISNSDSQEITLDSILGENFRCSEDKREFFEREIGKGFKFKVKFQRWLKANPDKTYQDAINAYYELQNSNEKTNIDRQFQYNQYIRDFFEDNEGRSLDDAIKCWKYKKSLKGHNRYEDSDLKILKS